MPTSIKSRLRPEKETPFRILWDLSGLHFLASKIFPQKFGPASPPFILWIIGIYAFLFGISLLRYNICHRAIENTVSNTIGAVEKKDFPYIINSYRKLQKEYIPIQPQLGVISLHTPLVSLLFSVSLHDHALLEPLRNILHKNRFNLDGARASGCDFRFPRFYKDGNFEKMNAADGNFRSTNLEFSNFFEAQLDRAIFSGANIKLGDFGGAHLFQANLSDANLGSANFKGADLRFANLVMAKSYHVNLVGANLLSANLQGAELVVGNLSNAILKNVDLEFANLQNANLQNADLENANLQYANLQNANLRNANLQYAVLKNAKFAGAIWIDGGICGEPSIGACDQDPPQNNTP